MDDPERRILHLELRLKEREAQLAAEREKCDKAKRKVRQLLAKISERDRKIANLSGKLEAEVASRKSNGYGGESQQAVAADLAKQRAAIVAQLEDHLAQMRQDLLESEYEIQELESRQSCKEEELGLLAMSDRSPERMQALAMIGLQIQDKKRFGTEMAHKIQALERQVHEERAVIVELLSGRPRRPTVPEPGVRPRAMQMPNALQAFLEAAGPEEARLIAQRPALLSAFAESQELTDGAIEGFNSEERIQILSLFTAWATVSTSALHVSDLQLTDEEVEEMVNTLESCEEVKEWEMTRCRSSNIAMRQLLNHLSSHALCRLGLSYNAIGLQGARLLGEAARIGGWKHSLGCLGLEMNGLGDAGCKQVASLVKQYLPALSVLELGWNEVTGASAADLAQLVRAPDGENDAGLPVLLRRLGLAGNSLASAASKLVLAALSDPSRELELDLSMNHVDAQALRDAAEWARARNSGEVQVHLTVSLEWNTIDDPEAVRDLANALSGAELMMAEAGQPLIQLANNELLDLQASEILDASANLIML